MTDEPTASLAQKVEDESIVYVAKNGEEWLAPVASASASAGATGGEAVKRWKEGQSQYGSRSRTTDDFWYRSSLRPKISLLIEEKGISVC